MLISIAAIQCLSKRAFVLKKVLHPLIIFICTTLKSIVSALLAQLVMHLENVEMPSQKFIFPFHIMVPIFPLRKLLCFFLAGNYGFFHMADSQKESFEEFLST